MKLLRLSRGLSSVLTVLLVTSGASFAADPPRKVTDEAKTERQSWRADQHLLGPAESREGERRLDAIEQKAKKDPQSADTMLRVWKNDRALSTQNRPTGGAGVDPPNSIIGPVGQKTGRQVR